LRVTAFSRLRFKAWLHRSSCTVSGRTAGMRSYARMVAPLTLQAHIACAGNPVRPGLAWPKRRLITKVNGPPYKLPVFAGA